MIPNLSVKSGTPADLVAYINVKLALLGFQPVTTGDASQLGNLVSTLVEQYREKERLLASHLCPADHRIQSFLYESCTSRRSRGPVAARSARSSCFPARRTCGLPATR